MENNEELKKWPEKKECTHYTKGLWLHNYLDGTHFYACNDCYPWNACHDAFMKVINSKSGQENIMQSKCPCYEGKECICDKPSPSNNVTLPSGLVVGKPSSSNGLDRDRLNIILSRYLIGYSCDVNKEGIINEILEFKQTSGLEKLNLNKIEDEYMRLLETVRFSTNQSMVNSFIDVIRHFGSPAVPSVEEIEKVIDPHLDQPQSNCFYKEQKKAIASAIHQLLLKKGSGVCRD